MTDTIPFIDLNPVVALVAARAEVAWGQIANSAQFLGGPWVSDFEAKLKRACSSGDAIACANGTDAIMVALALADIKPGDVVALPNLTFWATYEAVALAHAIPLLIDVDARGQLDVDALKRAMLSHSIKAVVTVHLYGFASERIVELRALCQSAGIRLIEDAAQAFGVKHQQRSIFEGADIATLSFYPAKVLGGAMDGGAIVVNNQELGARARRLVNHGRAQHYAYSEVGRNSRMGSMQAAYLALMLDHIDDIIAARRAANRRYVEILNSRAELITPAASLEDNGYLQLTLVDAPDTVAERMRSRGVHTGRVYPSTIDVQPPATAAIVFERCEVSKRIASRILNLPLFYGIKEQQIERAAACFIACANEVRP